MMINAQYFADPKALMPVPKLIFRNHDYGYWKQWSSLETYSLEPVASLLETIPSGSLILFDDQFCHQQQYAILDYYNSSTRIVYFKLLNDQLQPINATASLTWNDTTDTWFMRIQSACLYLKSYVENCSNDQLILNSCKIQDGILGAYTIPGR